MKDPRFQGPPVRGLVFLVPFLGLFPRIPTAQASQDDCRPSAWQGKGSVLKPEFGLWV